MASPLQAWAQQPVCLWKFPAEKPLRSRPVSYRGRSPWSFSLCVKAMERKYNVGSFNDTYAS